MKTFFCKKFFLLGIFKKASSRWALSDRLKIGNFENTIDYWMIPFKNGMAFNYKI